MPKQSKPLPGTVKFEIGFSSQLSMFLFLTHILCGTNFLRLALFQTVPLTSFRELRISARLKREGKKRRKKRMLRESAAL
jgi:hypothetical protein